jgi:hypothetical protein
MASAVPVSASMPIRGRATRRATLAHYPCIGTQQRQQLGRAVERGELEAQHVGNEKSDQAVALPLSALRMERTPTRRGRHGNIVKREVARVVEAAVIFVERGIEEAAELIGTRRQVGAQLRQCFEQARVDGVLAHAAELSDDDVQRKRQGVVAGGGPPLKLVQNAFVQHRTPRFGVCLPTHLTKVHRRMSKSVTETG